MVRFLLLTISLTLLIFNLKAEIVSKISISGNKRVSNETIKVYGDLEIGKNYTEAELDTTLKKLYNTDFFEKIDLNLENNILTINLKEYPIINQLVITYYLFPLNRCWWFTGNIVGDPGNAGDLVDDAVRDGLH